jgi:uncharacterized DUF497 family protein
MVQFQARANPVTAEEESEDPAFELVISPGVKEKLKDKHSVAVNEVRECFFNASTKTILDDREQHQTTPPTHWFISETRSGRLLKVVFIYDPATGKTYLKSAFPPNADELRIYGL